jgi:hypothetical protein
MSMGTSLAVYAYAAAGTLLWGYGLWLWCAYRSGRRNGQNGAKP